MKTLVAATVILFALCAASAGTVTVYDNIGPDNRYDGSIGYWFGNSSDVHYSAAAGSFLPNRSGKLATIEMALTHNCNIPAPAIVLSIHTGGSVPGEQLWTCRYDAPRGGVAAFEIADGPTLEEGTRYWVTAFGPEDVIGVMTWHPGYVNNGNYTAGTNNYLNGRWQSHFTSGEYALRVAVEGAVPEPLSCLGVLGGLASLTGYLRRRQVAR